MELFRIFGTVFMETSTASRALESLNARAAEAGSKFQNVLDGLSKFGVAAAAAGATLAAALSGKALASADELKSALNDLQAKTGNSATEMAGMQTVLTDIYNAGYGTSFKDIAQQMGVIAQQTGLSGEELRKATESALAMSDTFGIEVSESVRSANQLMKMFGISSDEAYNLIAQGAQAGLDANGNLEDTINEYSVHFSQLGLSSTDMFNSLANGASSGVFDMDKLGDAVKEFGIRSKDGSDTSVASFAALGFGAKELIKKFAEGGQGAKEAFQDVTTALVAMKDPVAQNTIGVSLFGTQWEDVGVKGIAALTNLNGSISASSGALDAIKNVKYDTFGEAITAIGRQFETAVVVPITERVLPKLSELSAWFTSNMPTIKVAVESATNGFITALEGASSLVMSAIDIYNQYKNAIDALAIGISAGALAYGIYTAVLAAVSVATTIAATATAAFGAAVAFVTSPIGLVVVGIAALVAAGYYLYANWDTVKQKLIDTWVYLQTRLGELANLVIWAIQNPFDAYVAYLTALWDTVGIDAGTAWTSIKESVVLYVTDAINGVMSLWEGFKVSMANMWESVKTEISTAWNLITAKFNEILPLVISAIQNPFDTYVAYLKALWELLGIDAGAAWASITEALAGYVTAAVDKVSTTLEGIKTAFSNVWESVKTAASEKMSAVKLAITGALDEVLIFMSELAGKTPEYGRNIVQGLIDGISSRIAAVRAKISELTSMVTTSFTSALGIRSPSTVFAGYGRNIGEGLLIGVNDMQPGVYQSVHELTRFTEPRILANTTTNGTIYNINNHINTQSTDPDEVGSLLVGRLKQLGVV
jgi:phage-related minor tail protein